MNCFMFRQISSHFSLKITCMFSLTLTVLSVKTQLTTNIIIEDNLHDVSNPIFYVNNFKMSSVEFITQHAKCQDVVWKIVSDLRYMKLSVTGVIWHYLTI